jgi:CHASE1-domain containing sensor protein
VTLLVLPTPAAQAGPEEELSKGQLVYVPVYSHVYHGDYERKILLTGILKLAIDQRQLFFPLNDNYFSRCPTSDVTRKCKPKAGHSGFGLPAPSLCGAGRIRPASMR